LGAAHDPLSRRLTIVPALHLALTSLLLGLAIACTADDDGAAVIDIDASTPDGGPTCAGTDCDGACVDVATDPLHCGGCGLACASPAQVCSGTVESCVCPDAFVPAILAPTVASEILHEDGGLEIGFGAFLHGSVVDAVLVSYDDEVELDVDHTLGAGGLPIVSAFHDVGPEGSHGAYRAITGTLRLTTACAVGVSGTLTFATFAEITPETGGVREGGCQFAAEMLEFSIGTTCP
jgi:hypothetical protein